MKNKIVLGLNLGHDVSACLLINGKIKVAIAEERLTRIKHEIRQNQFGELYCNLPHNSIKYCLNHSNIKIKDIDLIVASTTYVLNLKSLIRRELVIEDLIKQNAEFKNIKIEIIHHHLSHAVSSVWCSGFDKTISIVIDGGGSIIEKDSNGNPTKFERTSIYSYYNEKFILINNSFGSPPLFGNSIGDFYQLITKYLGFNSGMEGKTMGLASYGYLDNYNKITKSFNPLSEFRKAITIKDDGSHSVSPIFQYNIDNLISNELIELFGEPRKKPRPENKLDRHIAASAQWVIEETLLNICKFYQNKIKFTKLCLSGGVALNCVSNGKILDSEIFSDIFIQPASSDDGAAIGNALWGWKHLTNENPNFRIPNIFLGHKYSENEVFSVINNYKIEIIYSQPINIVKNIINDINNGLIVAIFKDGSEFGPRALGHRSIFCDPRLNDIKDHLNNKVKHRESFRPFGAICIKEDVNKYFKTMHESPFMLFATQVKPTINLPAVTHVDNSSRIQTIDKFQEPFLYEILKAFKELTGISVLLNTSFNIAGEPIVESPNDAINCLLKTNIDVLYIEHFRILRKENK